MIIKLLLLLIINISASLSTSNPTPIPTSPPPTLTYSPTTLFFSEVWEGGSNSGSINHTFDDLPPHGDYYLGVSVYGTDFKGSHEFASVYLNGRYVGYCEGGADCVNYFLSCPNLEHIESELIASSGKLNVSLEAYRVDQCPYKGYYLYVKLRLSRTESKEEDKEKVDPSVALIVACIVGGPFVLLFCAMLAGKLKTSKIRQSQSLPTSDLELFDKAQSTESVVPIENGEDPIPDAVPWTSLLCKVTTFLRHPLFNVAMQVLFLVVSTLGYCTTFRPMRSMREAHIALQSICLVMLLVGYLWVRAGCRCCRVIWPSWAVVSVIWIGRLVTVLNLYTVEVCQRRKYCIEEDDDDDDDFSLFDDDDDGCGICQEPCHRDTIALFIFIVSLAGSVSFIQLTALLLGADDLKSFGEILSCMR